MNRARAGSYQRSWRYPTTRRSCGLSCTSPPRRNGLSASASTSSRISSPFRQKSARCSCRAVSRPRWRTGSTGLLRSWLTRAWCSDHAEALSWQQREAARSSRNTLSVSTTTSSASSRNSSSSASGHGRRRQRSAAGPLCPYRRTRIRRRNESRPPTRSSTRPCARTCSRGSPSLTAMRPRLHSMTRTLRMMIQMLLRPAGREAGRRFGARIVRHGRYVVFQLAEVAVPRALFANILRWIDRLRLRSPPLPA